jgi:hypothetical protein
MKRLKIRMSGVQFPPWSPNSGGLFRTHRTYVPDRGIQPGIADVAVTLLKVDHIQAGLQSRLSQPSVEGQQMGCRSGERQRKM